MSYFKGVSIQSEAGLEMLIGAFGEALVATKRDDVNVRFSYPFYNEDFDLRPAVLTGSATATVSDSLLTLSTAVGETAQAQSREYIRYRNGHTGYADFTAIIGGATGKAEIGGVDDDGWFVGYDNDASSWYVGRRRGGTDFITTESSFNGNLPSNITLDPTKGNIFRIVFGYLGFADGVILVKVRKWYVLHVIETENALTTTTIKNPSFPIRAYAEEGATLSTASWGGGTLDGADVEAGARYFTARGSGTLSGTTVLTLGTFRNKSTYKGVTNKVKAKLLRLLYIIDAPATGTGTVEFLIRKNATLAGTPAYTDVDADNSVMEFDTTATYSSGGKLISPEYVLYAAGGGNAADTGGQTAELADRLGLFLLPEETATITAQGVAGTTNVTVRYAYQWIELF